MMLPRTAASSWLRSCRRRVTLTTIQTRHTRRVSVPPSTSLLSRWQHSSAGASLTAEQQPCVVVLGGGAIGLLFTALLSLTPQPPRLLVISRSLAARPTSAPAVRVELLPATAAGLNTGADGSAGTAPFTVPRSSIFPSTTALLSSLAAPAAIHAVLITTKGLPALSLAITDAEQLSRHSSQQPPLIIPVMNGIAHLSLLPTHFPPDRLVYATTSQGAHWATSDVVWQAGSGMTTFVIPARTEKGGESDGLSWFQSLVCSAAMDVRVAAADELLCVHWSKLLINCVINPLTALLNVRNGWLEQWLADDSSARHIVRHVAREVVAVGHCHGVTFAFEGSGPSGRVGVVSEAEVDAAVTSVLVALRVTAANVSSMASDVRAGRVTEVDGMNGEVVRLGEQYGVTTPYNRALWELVRELQPSDK